MPTLPPHRHRAIAESFGVDPDRYDRTRPRYPGPLIDLIVERAPGPRFLDVGTGTGIVARQLEAAGCTVLGVEVDERMADFARGRGLEVEVAAFEDWDPRGRSFDAVVAGQTWHWVDPVAGAAKAARVLRPGGRLTVFWNVFRPPAEVAQAFAAVYRRVAPDALAGRAWSGGSDGHSVLCGNALDGLEASASFGEHERWQFDWEQAYTRDDWLDQLPTHGDHNRLPTRQLKEVLAEVGAAIDTLGGSFTMGYRAVAISAPTAHTRTRRAYSAS